MTAQPLRGDHALDSLAESVSPLLAEAVDELHVAAVLESRGITDRVARERYDHEDVFALAVSVRPRLRGQAEPEDVEPDVEPAWRSLVHGPLYLVPGLVVPALIALLDADRLLAGLVAATLVGWVWGMGVSAVGYQLRGIGREAAAARTVALGAVAGVGAAALVSGGLSVTGALGAQVVAAAVLQTGYQLAAGVLAFHREERLLALAALPVFVCGIGYVVAGSPRTLAGPTVVAGVVTTVLAAAAGWFATRRSLRVPEPPGFHARLRPVRTVAPSVVYALVGAGLLLGTNTRFFHSGRDVALAAIPLVLGMGVVEWRAERFVEAGVRASVRCEDVAPYRTALTRRLLVEVAVVVAVLGWFGVIFLLALATADVVTPTGALLTAAHVLLGGVFLLGFVLARHTHFPWVLGACVAVVAVHLALLGTGTVTGDAVAAEFLAVVAALVLVLLTGFAVGVRHVRHFAW